MELASSEGIFNVLSPDWSSTSTATPDATIELSETLATVASLEAMGSAVVILGCLL